MRKPKTALTAERAREALSYDPETGVLTWRERARGRPFGKPAGARNTRGYVVMQIDGRLYLAHRVIWLMVHGDWPPMHIDHKNGNPSDNRLANLREADQCENSYNMKRRRDAGSGVKGVSLCPQTKLWKAAIQVAKKYHHLGRFKTKAEAAAAYREAAIRLCGEYARPD